MNRRDFLRGCVAFTLAPVARRLAPLPDVSAELAGMHPTETTLQRLCKEARLQVVGTKWSAVDPYAELDVPVAGMCPGFTVYDDYVDPLTREQFDELIGGPVDAVDPIAISPKCKVKFQRYHEGVPQSKLKD